MFPARCFRLVRPAVVTRSLIPIVMACATALVPGDAFSDAFLFEPSVGLDQRFDDNYLLDDSSAGFLTATRAFAEIRGSREGRTAAFRGSARIDQEIVNGDGRADGADSDRYFELDSVFRNQRLRYGTLLGYRKDTTSRDISSDLSDEEDFATDPGLSVTQLSSVDREEFTIEPTIEYDLSRRMVLEASLGLTQVNHELPYPRDEVFSRYENIRQNAIESGGEPLPVIPFDEITIDDVTPDGFAAPRIFNDFVEIELELDTRYKLSETRTLTGKVAYSDFTSQVDPDAGISIPFEDLELDPDNPRIQRKPTRDSITRTSRFTLGYEQSLSQITSFGVEGGVYYTDIDNTDTLRSTDLVFEEGEFVPVGETDESELTSSDDGWLANLTFTRDDGVLRYVGKYSVDVVASSTGSQVEATTLTGDVFWQLNPRLEVSLRTRAYEPKTIAIDSEADNQNPGEEASTDESRRFISFEPRISWEYSRAWSVSAAYRYRRQRASSEDVSSGSNALLFTLRYTPPSALRAAADSEGF